MKKTTFYLFKLTTIAFALPEGIALNSESLLQARTQRDFTTSNTSPSMGINAMIDTNKKGKHHKKYEA